MSPINWEAIIGICALCSTVAGIVHLTVKAVLRDFKEDLRKEFTTIERFGDLERRVNVLENRA